MKDILAYLCLRLLLPISMVIYCLLLSSNIQDVSFNMRKKIGVQQNNTISFLFSLHIDEKDALNLY